MSEMTSGVVLKSSTSDGELMSEKQILKNTNESDICNDTANLNLQESKLKRTLTLTRNAFSGSRSSKRRGKHKDSKDNLTSKGAMVIEESDNMDIQKQNKKLFRRPSWNKIFTKMVQKVTTIGVQNNKNICSNYVYSNRRRYTMSLSSSDIRVPPTKPLLIGSGDKVPGVMGLRNHGNTCFINAVLQCLSHTDILAEYFVLDQYKMDLSRRNKLNSKKYGTKGEVTEQLALLLKAIWSCQYDPEMSNKFKLIVDKYGSQYRGNNQHDAQEFLLWLLDKVHEDLNTATKKKYKIIKDWHQTEAPMHDISMDAMAEFMASRERFAFPHLMAQAAVPIPEMLNPAQLLGNFPLVRRTRGPRAVRYIKDENGVKFYMCEYCDYKCRSPGNLAKHVRRHTGEKPYECPYCDYKAADRGSIKSHVRRHTGERPYKCTYCDYRSPYTSTLRAHMRKHTGEKPYFCTKCDYRCSQKGDLGIHMRKHSGHKPYPCTVCNQRFTVSSALVNHMRTHTKEKPFKCIICGDTFAQSGNLKSHLFSHTTEKQFNCEHCNYGTNRKKLLVKHVAKHGKSAASAAASDKQESPSSSGDEEEDDD